MSLLGKDHFPSSAYVTVDASHGTGPLHIIEEGAGPEDGFSGYRAFHDGADVVTRWGDYNGAAVDGDRIWVGTGIIAQTCTFEEFKQGNFGTCGGTRIASGNWSTILTRLRP